MERFLVTGGAGFIGSNLCERLLETGRSVRVLDNLSTGRLENLDRFIDRLEFIEGDVACFDTVREAVDGVDYVIHLAALSSVPASVDDPVAAHRINATGTLNVLKASRESGARRVVYASTSAVYGNNPLQPKKETMVPEPESPYAAAKLAGEHYCRVFSSVYGVETVSLRYFNIYGMRQDPSSEYAAVIPIFITAVLDGRRPTIFGDGEQTRDFIFVEDCVEANIRASYARGVAGMCFNIGSGRRTTLNELFEKIREAAGCNVSPLYAPPRKGDVRHSLADISRAAELLSFEPSFDMDAGLRKTIDWYRQGAGQI